METDSKHKHLLIGSREKNVIEPKTLNAFIEKAKNLGFSKNEIERLQECYSQIIGKPK